jgi:hypothetical protein
MLFSVVGDLDSFLSEISFVNNTHGGGYALRWGHCWRIFSFLAGMSAGIGFSFRVCIGSVHVNGQRIGAGWR